MHYYHKKEQLNFQKIYALRPNVSFNRAKLGRI